MDWKYAHEPCKREPSVYDQYLHTSVHPSADEMTEDRLEYMWCTSCEAYLWGNFTITEEP